MKIWGTMVNNAKNYLLDLKKDRLLSHWENKKYDKISKMFKTYADYNSLKFNEFPFVYFLINEGDLDGTKAVLDKAGFKDQILQDDNNPMSITPIAYAFLQEKDDIVELLGTYGASLSKPNSSMQNILHTAAIYKRQQAFKKAAADKKIDINLGDEFGNTPFHYAARSGSLEMVATMVAARAKKVANKFHQYPIHMAIQSGSEECVDALTSDLNGAYPKYSPIHSASRSGSSRMIEKVLAAKPASLNFQDYKGLTALHHSVLMEDPLTTSALLNVNGVNIDRQDEFGNTALHLAFMNESAEMAKLLIDKEADLEIANEDQMSPVEYGIASTNKSIRSMLLTVAHRSEKIQELSRHKY